MKNEVMISIKGIQHEFGEDGVTEMITAGNYYLKNGKHYVLYDEAIPETSEQMSNTLKITKDRVELIKHGRFGTHMLFEVGKKNMSMYPTPYGIMEMCFNTFDIEVTENETSIHVKILYALEINDGFVSDCTLEMIVRSKEH